MSARPEGVHGPAGVAPPAMPHGARPDPRPGALGGLAAAGADRLAELARDLATPVLLLDPARIEAQYRALGAAFPGARIHYAIKANPAAPVVAALARAGAGFELASVPELELVRPHGVPPERLVFGNTIKRAADVAVFRDYGVDLFASDCEADIRMLARAAPGARVYVRLLAEPSATADWPLDRKFGCTPESAVRLLLLAADLGLVPHGVSFHVGSQQRSPEPWDGALRRAAWVFNRCAEHGVRLGLVNLGGGFPVAYDREVPPIGAYGEAISGYLREHFAGLPGGLPELMLEPGRYLVAESGVLVTEVMQVARKEPGEAPWAYLDVGLFGGLTEADHEATRYPVLTGHAPGPESEMVLAGPTCDGRDILYDRNRYALPESLSGGDRLYLRNAGAYTVSCGSVGYNGFAPVRVEVVGQAAG